MGKKWKLTAALAAAGSAIASALYLKKKENRDKVKKTVHDIEGKAISATKKAMHDVEEAAKNASEKSSKKAKKAEKTATKKASKAKKTVRKKTNKAAKKVAKKTKTPSLKDIDGVGPATAKKLKDAKITSVAQIKRYKNPESLAKKADLGETEAENIIKEANKL
jgi:predicted flap endonuclease-1-like 5' DNA nuclease